MEDTGKIIEIDREQRTVTFGNGTSIDQAPLTASYVEVARRLAEITYRPGWKFRLDSPVTIRSLDPWEAGANGYYLLIETLVEDAGRPESAEKIRLTFSFALTSPTILDMAKSERDFLYWIRKFITDAELHERDEWMRYRGVKVFDPHAPAGAVSRPVDLKP